MQLSGASGSITQVTSRPRSAQAGAAGWNLVWLGKVADRVEAWMQRFTSSLAGMIGDQWALLLMLPVGLMLRPLLALARSAQRSRPLCVVCGLIIAGGAVAGPWVGTRAGLVLIPLYALGWTYALRNLNSLEAAEIERVQLVRATRLARKTLARFRVEVPTERRN